VIPAVIIPVLNRFDLLEHCISTIDCEVENLLIIDNSGSYSIPKGLYDQKVWVLNMPANLGVAGSWNLGIKSFPFAPYWVVASNDVFFQPRQLERFAEISRPDLLIKSTQSWGCFSLGSDIVKKVGLFDENFHPAYYEDVDYETRLASLNLSKSLIFSDIEIGSHGAATTIRSNPVFERKNAETNQSNYEYWQIKSTDIGHMPSKDYQLQRRIDNDLFT